MAATRSATTMAAPKPLRPAAEPPAPKPPHPAATDLAPVTDCSFDSRPAAHRSPRPPDPSSGSKSTSDLYLAAFLICSGARLSDSHSDGKRTIWTFSGVDPNSAHSYLCASNDLVSASHYANTIRQLKRSIFESR